MGLYADLKKFLTQSTFITMAVAFVVGVQVGLVIAALVSSVINPLIAVFFKTNFANIGLVTVNGSTFTFGILLGAVITFLVVLIVVFLAFVYPYSKYQARQAAKAGPTTKTCPECCSTIPLAAKRCAFCTTTLPPDAPAAKS